MLVLLTTYFPQYMLVLHEKALDETFNSHHTTILFSMCAPVPCSKMGEEGPEEMLAHP